MRRIAVINHKGGVGKTTTTLNLAHALALAGRKVLALDMDPQGQLGAGLGVHDAQAGLDAVLLDGEPLEKTLVGARERLLLAPAGGRLAEYEFVEGGAERGTRLKEAIEQAPNGHDVALIDAPPSTGLLAMNALLAVDEVLVPVCGDYLSLHALGRFMRVLEHIDDALGRKTRTWIALTRFHARRRLAGEVRAKLVEYFPGRVLVTAVRESAPLAESPGSGKTIFEYRAGSHGAQDYTALAQDLLDGRTLQ
jgi:chromosome partitioning protein